MATGTVQPPPPRPQTAPASPSRQTLQVIERQLGRTKFHVRLVDLLSRLAILIVGVLAFLLAAALIDHWWFFPLGTWGRAVAFLLLVGGSLYYVVTQIAPLFIRRINETYAARAIEESRPSLKNSLINFLLLRGDRGGVREVVYEALQQRAAEDIADVKVESAVDRAPVIRVGYVLLGVLALCAAYKILSPKDPFQTIARVVAPWADIDRPSRVQISDVQPGDATVYRGRSQVISAAIDGVRDGQPVKLVYSTADGQTTDREVPMQPGAGGVRFSCELPPVEEKSLPDAARPGLQQDITYRVVAGDAATSDFRLSVVDAPAMVVERVEYQFPAYTNKAPQTSPQGDIRALEGTKVTIFASANQPIRSAVLEFDPAAGGASGGKGGKPLQSVPLQVEGQKAWTTLTLLLKPDRATAWHGSYQVRFISSEGGQSEQPVVHAIEVARDLAPEVQILAPAKKIVDVPENGSLAIEVRAIDPDYALSKLALRGTSGGKTILDQQLLKDANASPQAVAKYVFRPSEHQLTAGNEMTYAAIAADNRASPLSGAPEPNEVSTAQYVVRVTAPREAKPPERNPEAKPQAGEDKQEEKSGEKPMAGEKPMPGERPEDGASEKPEKQTGEKNEPEKSETTRPDEKKPEEKSGDKKQEEGDGGSKSEQKQQSSASGSSQQSGGQEKSSGGSSGNASEGSGGKPMEGSGDASPDGAGGQGSGKPEQSSQPGASANSGQGSKGSNSESSGNSTQESSESGEGGEGNEGGAGASGKPSKTEHPGEAIEKILQHRESKGSSNSAGGQEGTEQKPGESGSEQKPGESPQTKSGEPQGGEKGGQPQAGDKAGTKTRIKSGEQGPMPAAEGKAGGEQNGQKGGGEKTGGETGEKQPMPGAGENPGEKADSEGKAAQEGKPDQEGKGPGQPMARDKTGEKGGKQPNGAGAEEKTVEKSPSKGASGSKPREGEGKGQKPTGAQGEKKEPGMGKTGESGAAQKTNDKKGSGESQGDNRDQKKSQQPDNSNKTEGSEPSPPSGSKKQSDSKGGESGDKSGGGKKGAGQAGNQAGNENPGSNSVGDKGAGAANEAGKGTETGDIPGQDQKSGGPEGADGDKSQGGSESRAGKSGKDAGGKSGEPPPGSESKAVGPSDQNNASREATGDKGDPGPALGGGGKPGDPSQPPPPGGQPVEGDKANLEYARKATEMALEHLRDQKQEPDPELLKELGWTKEELQEFVRRWEAMEKAAKQDPKSQRELDESLRSLGLRPAKNRKRAGGTTSDNQRDLRDSGSRSSAPPSYREQFEQFRKGAGRSE